MNTLVGSILMVLTVGCATATYDRNRIPCEARSDSFLAESTGVCQEEVEMRNKIKAVTVTLNPAVVQECTRVGMVNASADRARSVEIHGELVESQRKLDEANANLGSALAAGAGARGRSETTYTYVAPYTEPDWTPTLARYTVKAGGNTLLKGGDPLSGEAYLCPATPAR